ncbi:hypothetical protein CVT25_003952 [Psilocybe cyanescens]|uniref:Uncharacterized protein n=1 Tax=Psilocybe cyanescens TaxID=93625 RepID=A0A409VX46_PSICY|nr:hypothetical protein CVT25_003952 [Psilocybe cyanescens]
MHGQSEFNFDEFIKISGNLKKSWLHLLRPSPRKHRSRLSVPVEQRVTSNSFATRAAGKSDHISHVPTSDSDIKNLLYLTV